MASSLKVNGNCTSNIRKHIIRYIWIGKKKTNSKNNNNLGRAAINKRKQNIQYKIQNINSECLSEKMMNGNTENNLQVIENQNAAKTHDEANTTNSKNGGDNKLNGKSNGAPSSNQNGTQPKNSISGPPVSTFENANFNDLMNQFEGSQQRIQPALELSQAFQMSSNFKEAAAIVNGSVMLGPALTANSNQLGIGDKVGSAPDGVDAGASYFYKTDYIADLSKKCSGKDFAQISKLLTNMGTSDKASNWLLEQRTLQRAMATEGRDLRDLIQDKTVDQLEYVRIKENITQAKQRAKKLFDEDASNDSEKEKGAKDQTSQSLSETQEDSGQAKMLKTKRHFNDKKINGIIKQIRYNAKQYLGSKDGRNYEKVPLTTICRKLRKEANFLRKRDAKDIQKLQSTKEQLLEELKTLNSQSAEKKDLAQRLQSIESVLGLEKRLKTEAMDKTVAEIDMNPMSAKAFDIQNVLFDYCGINLQGQNGADHFSNQKRIERLFGKIRKLPKKSCLLSNFEENVFDPTEDKDQAKKADHQELVKVIGLEPHKLFEQIPKYKINIDRMPKFSNNFDTVDSVNLGIQNKQSIPGQQIINPVNSHMTFQRIDGRQVISLQFNPYFIGDDLEKKQIYEGYMRDILDQREKIKNAPKEAKNKQETQNIKRAWNNIVKKDIPKAYRMYQKFKADQENNNKKISQNCLKEVRKRAVRTQRLAKESVMRARKLTKEMSHFWRKRDKEMADGKRKREKLDKELKKKQQEEEEALLQKKRLEYLMQQSEVYAHFMATKLGVADDLHKVKEEMQLNKSPMKKIDVDKRAARIHIAGMINENRRRLDDFDDHDRDEINEDDLDDEKIHDNKTINVTVTKPKMFLGDLKAYQLKGLQWLDNLYDQGINGILADEMGLGKTIQTIALLAHLAEKKNVWGPFLIIVPVTTLHNWQNELAKFCPDLKVLPYFGSAEERKKLAKFLDPKNLYNPAMCIHVLITSYNLIVGGGKDQLRLQRVKWHYMILDEAQAIKNNASRRWKTLLQFNTRNRLLLSGTPIQNSMAELWALLHFIMPKLFDNHEQFQEWFSKDIEQHSMDQGELNKHQLKRLHLILQPFMLRRLKKDVEQEIAPKTEEIIQCEMTHRQRVLYDRIKRKISAQDLFMLASSKAKVENLMNLVMQFRKVCNHPDLFERRMGKIPYMFSKMQHGMQQNMLLVSKPDVTISTSSPIKFELPKMVFDECFLISDNNTKLFSKHRKFLDVSFNTVSVETHFSLFNIFNEKNLHENIFKEKQSWNSAYSILGLLMRSNGWSYGDISYQAVADKLVQAVSLLHFYSKKSQRNSYMNLINSEKDTIELSFGQFGMVYSDQTSLKYKRKSKNIDIMCREFVTKDNSFLYKQRIEDNIHLHIPGQWTFCQAMVPEEPKEFLNYTRNLYQMTNIYFSKCIASTIELSCASTSFQRHQNSITNNPIAKKLLIGKDFKPDQDRYIGKIGRDRSSFLTEDSKQLVAGPPTGYSLFDNGLLSHSFQEKGSSTLQLPDYSRLITDCSKMGVLHDILLKRFKGGHRCLIFCQMTKMMDILEDFLIWQKYTYFRMDGSTQLQDRRFMVEEFQTNPNIFIFILSTRAGGLGINLIAADTVIFYDNDWNPTMDAQATDRAHRIGQKKKVMVYRLVTKNTVEERILRRARQKENVQSTVYGANLKADSFSTRDVVDMIIDDIDDPLMNLGTNRNQVKGFIKGPACATPNQQKGKKKRKKKNDDSSEGALYESVKKIDKHAMFENEIDALLDENERAEIAQAVIAEVSGDEEGQSEDEEEAQARNLVSGAKTAMDKKRLLLQMLDKQSGGKKQTFNFEEDDTAHLNGTLNKPAPEKEDGEPKRQRGRPAAGKKEEMQLADDNEDDEMEDEEVEY